MCGHGTRNLCVDCRVSPPPRLRSPHPVGPGEPDLSELTGPTDSTEAPDMSIKRILLPIPGTADQAGEIDMALSAAKALAAHVEALFITQPPPPRVGDIPFRRNGSAAASSVNWWAEVQDRLARAAQDRFVEACTARDIPIASSSEGMLALPSASWQAVEGSYQAVAVQRAAAFDLIVA